MRGNDSFARSAGGALVAVFIIANLFWAFWGIRGVYYAATHKGWWKEEVRKVQLRNDIETAVSVSGLENKFVQAVGLFGGAGGQGAPEVVVDTPQKFVELVPPGEKIYVAGTKTNYDDYRRTYWAFIENRAGLVRYSELYVQPEGGFAFSGVAEDQVIFWKSNGANLAIKGFISIVLAIIVACGTASWIYEQSDSYY